MFVTLCLVLLLSVSLGFECGEFSHLFTKKQYKHIQNKRIRKEVRDLKESDWDDIVDAIWIMKTTPQEIGKRLYGDKFNNYDRLVCKHMISVNDTRGDMGHSSANFLIYHRAYVLEFENSLYAINNNLNYGIPYWNFRLDEETLDDSIIFGNNYFGSRNGNINFKNQVTNGKFKYFRINFADETPKCNNFKSNYGLLRGPMNLVDNLHLTRYGSYVCDIPDYFFGDSTYYDSCLNENDYISWNDCTYFTLHVPAHTGIGGTHKVYNNQPDIDYEFYKDYVGPTLCKQWSLASVRKNGINIRSISKKWNCFNNIYRSDNNLCQIGIDSINDCFPYLNTETCNIEDGLSITFLPRDTQHLVGDFGDLYSSPNDPIFWPHHANLDRLFMEWQLYHYYLKDSYYGAYNNSNTYNYGLNLNDIISSLDPFLNLFDSNSVNPNKELTIKDIFDNTDILNAPYTYDTILNAINPNCPKKRKNKNSNRRSKSSS